mgnify:CR=1 FL=1
MKINPKYLIAFFVLLLIEIGIGLFVHDNIIRPYIGDVLVVVLIYTFIRGITKITIWHLPLYVFLFAAAVELAQYFRIVEMLHLQNNKIVSTIIGTSFDIKDIVCYLIAAAILTVWEHRENKTIQRHDG